MATIVLKLFQLIPADIAFFGQKDYQQAEVIRRMVADLNVPVKDGKVTSDARITASMPTVEHCLKAGAKVMVMSHRGRPEEGVYSEENSMAPIAADMSAKLGKQDQRPDRAAVFWQITRPLFFPEPGRHRRLRI